MNNICMPGKLRVLRLPSLLFLVALMGFVTVAVAGTCPSDGDVNRDTRLTPADAQQAFQDILGLITLDVCARQHANVFDILSSDLTPADVLCILRRFLSLQSCLDPLVVRAGTDQFVARDPNTGAFATVAFEANTLSISKSVTFRWALTEVPDGSTITDNNLSAPFGVRTAFTPDVVGQYRLRLMVTDERGDTATDTVAVRASEQVPNNHDFEDCNCDADAGDIVDLSSSVDDTSDNAVPGVPVTFTQVVGNGFFANDGSTTSASAGITTQGAVSLMCKPAPDTDQERPTAVVCLTNDAGIATARLILGSAPVHIVEASIPGRLPHVVFHIRNVNDSAQTAPTVRLLSPSPDTAVVAGQLLPIIVDTTDDVAVQSVSFFVNDVRVFTDPLPPYQFLFRVPTDVANLTLGATALDFANNPGTSENVAVEVVNEPVGSRPFVVGSFDQPRGGTLSLTAGDDSEQARTALQTHFPGAELRSLATLSPDTSDNDLPTAMTGVQLLMLASGAGAEQGITPLSMTEQTALRNFVRAGGCAVLLVDNDSSGGAAAHASLLAPFGLSSGGGSEALVNAMVTDPTANGLTDGAFGTILGLTQQAPGGLRQLGEVATALATNPLGTALAAIAPDTLSPGAGALVVYADTDTFGDVEDGFLFADNEALFLNTITFCLQGGLVTRLRAVADRDSTPEDTPVQIDVRANDLNESGAVFTITEFTQGAAGLVSMGNTRLTYSPAPNRNGADTFTYSISHGLGVPSTATVTVIVTPVNDAPTFVAGPNQQIIEDAGPQTVTGWATAISDGDPEVTQALTFMVTTTRPELFAVVPTVSPQTGALRYTPAAQANGVTRLTLALRDDGGTANGGQNTSTAQTVTLTIEAINDAPVAVDDMASTQENMRVVINVLNNDTDVDNGLDPMTVTPTQPSSGTAVSRTNGTIAYTPTSGFSGLDMFTYTVADDAGAVSNVATVTVAVNALPNTPPMAVADQAETNEDQAVIIDVLANDSDADVPGDSLTVINVSQPDRGTVVNNTNGVTYTPDADFNGQETFTYTVGDGRGGIDTAMVTVMVQPVNDPPVAVDDSATTDEDRAVVVPVLTNDSDVESANLTVLAVTDGSNGTVNTDGTTVTYTPDADFNGIDSFTYTLGDDQDGQATATVTVTVNSVNDSPTARDDTPAAVDEDSGATSILVLANDTAAPDTGETLLITGVTQGSDGSVVIRSGGTRLTYSPNADFFGEDIFTYTISDGQGGSDTATVTITVNSVNDPPVASDDMRSTQESTPVVIDVLSNDTDVDSALAVATVSAAQPTNGAAVAQEDGSITYTPDPGFSGLDTFTYTIDDDDGATSNTATVTISVTMNQPPVAVDDTATTDEDLAVDITVLANDSDLDGMLNVATVQVITLPEMGTTQVNSSGTITYTPATDFAGADTFTYQVRDNLGALSNVAAVSVTINPINDAPVASDDTAMTEQDVAIILDVLGNDTDVDNALDATTLTVVVDPGNGNAVVNTSDGTITYTPTTGFFGNDTFSYTVADVAGAVSNEALVVVAVNEPDNQPPQAVADLATTDEDASLDIDVLGNDTDPDDSPDSLTVVAVSQPANGAVMNNASTVSYVPDVNFNGQDTFTYMVSDGRGGADTASVTVTVQPVNDVPTAVDDSASTNEDTAIALVVLLNDSDVENDALSVTDVTQGNQGSVTHDSTMVTYTPGGNFFGEDMFTYTVDDGQEGTAIATVTVTVNAVNDRPTFNASTPPLGLEDSGQVSINAWAIFNAGVANEAAQTATYSVSNVSQPALFTTLPAVASNGTLTYTPSADALGSSMFTVQVQDNGGTANGGVDTSLPQTYTLTVRAVNDAPAFSASAPPAVLEDSGMVTIEGWATFSPGAANESGQSATYMVTDVGNAALFAVLPGVDSNGTLTYTSQADASGTSTFDVQVQDSGGTANGGVDTSATQTFTITVTAVQDAPVAVADNATTAEDTAVIVAVLNNDSDADNDTLTITNVTQGANGTVTMNGTTVTYTPASHFNGMDSFTYTLSDGQDSDIGNVAITVTPVNDAPAFVRGADVQVLEDVGPRTVTAWATAITDGDPEVSQTLTFVITDNTNPALFATEPSVEATTGDLSFTPVANSNGVARITLELTDNGGTLNGGVDTSAPQMFMVQVNAVNDTPTFVAGPDVRVIEDAGPQTVTAWATAIADGDPEVAQVLTFVITDNTNTALFAAGPAVNAATGTLTYTPAPDANGTAMLTLELQDDGGTLNGGQNTSAAQTFRITIAPVADAPVAAAGSDALGVLGRPFIVDGRGSSDADDPDQLLDFQWTFMTSPVGSLVTFSDPQATAPFFTPDKPGLYEAALVVNDGTFNSDPDTVLSTILPVLNNPFSLAVETLGTLVVVDNFPPAVLRVDPDSGEHTLISNAVTGSGTAFGFPQGIAVEPAGTLVVVDSFPAAVVRVNPLTGDRTIVSSATMGSGPAFISPQSIAVEAAGTLVVVDTGLDFVVRVNPSTGDRTFLAPIVILGNSTPPLQFPRGIAVEPAGTLVVADNFPAAVVRVNPSTGNYSIVSDAMIGSGPPLQFLEAIVVEESGALAVVDSSLGALVRVDPNTGNRTIVADTTTGNGPTLPFPQDLAVMALRPTGAALMQGDDDFDFVTFTQGFSFPFFGITYPGVFVSSNGRLTFDFGDTEFTETLDVFTNQPQIAPFFDDLNPAASSGDVFVAQFPDRLMVTWYRLGEFGLGGSNTFRVVLFSDGKVQLRYGSLTAADAIIGISPGQTLTASETDFSAMVPFSTLEPVEIFEQFTGSSAADSFDLAGRVITFIPNASNGFDVDIEAADTFMVVDRDLAAVVDVDAMTGDRTVVADPAAGSGPTLPSPVDIAVATSGALFVVDEELVGIVRIDPSTGDRTILSDATTGSGPMLQFPQSLDIEAAGTLVVVDSSLAAVVRVDPDTGERTIVSDADTGSGPLLQYPQGIVVEAAGTLVVVDSSLAAVVRINPLTGDRSIISSATMGSGPAFISPESIAVEAGGTLVVVDFGRFAVLRVDPATGNRTMLADLAPGRAIASLIKPQGEGPSVGGIAVEEDGTLVVAVSGFSALIRIDPATGEQTDLANFSTGTGLALQNPQGIAVEASGTILVVDNVLRAVLRVDPTTGDRMLLAL